MEGLDFEDVEEKLTNKKLNAAWWEATLKRGGWIEIRIRGFEKFMKQVKNDDLILSWSPLHKILLGHPRWKALHKDKEAQLLYYWIHLTNTSPTGCLQVCTESLRTLYGGDTRQKLRALQKLEQVGLVACFEVLEFRDNTREKKIKRGTKTNKDTAGVDARPSDGVLEEKEMKETETTLFIKEEADKGSFNIRNSERRSFAQLIEAGQLSREGFKKLVSKMDAAYLNSHDWFQTKGYSWILEKEENLNKMLRGDYDDGRKKTPPKKAKKENVSYQPVTDGPERKLREK